ncbi:MAG TPA: flagellar basal body-associated FliL family protein [Coprothermobacter sp.]|nr:flagellar basal body-associated FliL family protein [Coprothermobacter sp.]
MKKILVYLVVVVLLLGVGMALGVYVLAPVVKDMGSNTKSQSKPEPVLQPLGKFTTNLSNPKYIIQVTVNLEFYDKKALSEVQKMDPSFLVIQDELLKYFKTLKPEDFSSDKGITLIQENFVKRINNLYGKTILSGVLFGADTVITVMP